MPLISVIVPAYNHEKYVGHTIESILGQTFQDFEIIIADDCSKDQTVKEIKKFKDPRIKLFQFEKNQGACVVVNHCISFSEGKYIAILSSDDIFLPNKLEKQVCFLDSNPNIGAVFSYAQIIDSEGHEFADENHFYCHIFNQPNRNRFEWLNYFFYKRNCLCHPSILIRKECYKEVGYYDPRFAQLPDFDMWIRLCLQYEIHIIPEKLIKFRIHNDNTSGNKPDKVIRAAWELKQILKKFLAIKAVEFWKVFPNAMDEVKNFPDDLVLFLVAKLALEVNSPIYQSFAIDTFHELLSDEGRRARLVETFGFDYIDFIYLSGQYDFFKQQTFQLVSKPELKEKLPEIIGVRNILIWGSGTTGEKTLLYLNEIGLKVFGFIDINSAKWGKAVQGIPIFPPTYLEGFREDINKPYVIIGSMFIQDIEPQLKSYGLKWVVDYFPPVV